jgi:peptide/nickel transport system ATP-binding protein
MLLSVSDLRLSINDTAILRDVDLQLDAGQVLGLIGESGSGKSMTAFSIMQLLPAGSDIAGRISFDGVDLLQLTEAQMCEVRGDEIGMVFQEPMTALNPLLTIGDQVAETVRIHSAASRREAHAIALDTLRRVELPPEQYSPSRYPHELSGGQRQRVVIAMAIALRPKLLIADEPTTALDVTTQAQILALLRRLVDEDGMGLILISHDLAVVANTADSISIMRNGQVLDHGPAQSIFSELKHPYTQALFEASSHVPERVGQTSDNDSALLVVDRVTRDYRLPRDSLFAARRYFRAVDEVSFEIHRGENVGLVGESGCGKSTLTRAILGLDPIQHGTIKIGGDLIRAGMPMPRELRRRMQVVFQDPYGSFNPRHRVSRLITEPYHLLDDPPGGSRRIEAVNEALESVGLRASDSDKYIHEFSGGQRQRIAIARALIIRPQLIILDEAVSALDVSVRAQVLDLLAELSDRLQLSYLFISHDLSVVRSICDRVLVMQAGKIVEQGNTKDIFERPTDQYTASLVEAIPRLPDIGQPRQ